MERRPLGTTGHDSSVVTFGGFAAQYCSMEGANHLLELARQHGINHVDVAPTYGDAEIKLGPKLQEHREAFFVGCKTRNRDREGARKELRASLGRMGLDMIDLYQFHALTSIDEIDRIMADDGALAAVEAAKEEGLINHIGVTSHGRPAVIKEAIERLPVETVMLPFNPVLAASDDPDENYLDVIKHATDAGLGVMIIKTFAEEFWDDSAREPTDTRPFGTWYRPVESIEAIRERLRYVLSHDVTTLTHPGDPSFVFPVVDAANQFEELDEATMRAIEADHSSLNSPVPMD